MEWILASASPRRRQLLQQIGDDVRVWPANVDESPRPGEAAPDLVRRLARTKAEAVAAAMAQTQERGSAPILAADTVVVLAEEILNKPADAAEAVAMLGRLSGQMHEVWTGLCVLRPGTAAAEAAEVTRVWFAPISAAEIAAYVSSGEPLDKAGAYGIQGPAAQYIPRIEGSYSNVMGLPLHLLRGMLA